MSATDRLRLAASAFDHAPNGIVIADVRGRILDVNQAFVEASGYSRQELLGGNPRMLKSGRHPPEFYAELWRTLHQAGLWRGEIWNRRKDGEAYVEMLTISAVRGPQGEVSHYVGIYTDISALKEHQKNLERMAHYDALTQLPNRVLFSDRLRIALAQARRAGKLLAVCYLDLDGFKPINDCLGHEAGDRLLEEVGVRLRYGLRGGDTVARLGGDEFAMLLRELSSAEECWPALARIFSAMAKPFVVGGGRVDLSASIGVALFPRDGDTLDDLLRNADRAMYCAKQGGRNCYRLVAEPC